MNVRFESVLFRTPEPSRAAGFWAALLGRRPAEDGDEVLLPGREDQVGLRFTAGPPHGALDNRLHLHLSQTERSQRETIAQCLAAGGRLQGSGNVPPGSFAVMSDPIDDEFCVIEDDDAYLAGCGPLGEVTCEGTRAVGLFWSEAMGWPLVWEEGDETAIQSPAGGTKLAWSGDAPDPARDHTRQRFVLAVDASDLDDEVARLVVLGASDVGPTALGHRLRDPDGIDFDIRPV